ncbi:MFS transporter [Halodurantibacterium flavum]|uniref:MFS transporter n=1 Tax=Halodurantibacterium flavum TaxID=1382802 RepID=A0ABW4S6A7_9RHOB
MGRTNQRRIWGWYFFDWANQPYNTLLLTFIFGPYFASAVASDPVRGQEIWGWMLSATGLCIALLAPLLGAIADSGGKRRPWIVLWSALYLGGSFALWWAVPGMDNTLPILLAFAVGMIGLEFGIIFTNAMLPDLAPRSEIGRVSGSGWAFGYVGGVLSLAVMLLLLAENDAGVTLIGQPPALGLDPGMREGTRAVGPFTALWYLVFVIPFFLWVPETGKGRLPPDALRRGITDLARTLRSLPRRTSLSAWLGSSMLYRDALNGIYAFGGIYAAGVLGWSIVQIGVFGIMAAITGAIFCWIGGRADRRLGPRPVIVTSILALIGVCLVVVLTDRSRVLGLPVAEGSSLPDIVFYICGGLIGGAGGALQAASRTMMVHQADPARMTEAFGLYALSGKATAFLAPALVAATTAITNDQGMGVLPLMGLFILGLVLLVWVKPEGEGTKPWHAPEPR